MKINMTGMSYNFDTEGMTTVINVNLSGYADGNNLNCSVSLTGEGLDDLTRKEAQQKAIEQVQAWLIVE